MAVFVFRQTKQGDSVWKANLISLFDVGEGVGELVGLQQRLRDGLRLREDDGHGGRRRLVRRRGGQRRHGSAELVQLLQRRLGRQVLVV